MMINLSRLSHEQKQQLLRNPPPPPEGTCQCYDCLYDYYFKMYVEITQSNNNDEEINNNNNNQQTGSSYYRRLNLEDCDDNKNGTNNNDENDRNTPRHHQHDTTNNQPHPTHVAELIHNEIAIVHNQEENNSEEENDSEEHFLDDRFVASPDHYTEDNINDSLETCNNNNDHHHHYQNQHFAEQQGSAVEEVIDLVTNNNEKHHHHPPPSYATPNISFNNDDDDDRVDENYNSSNNNNNNIPRTQPRRCATSEAHPLTIPRVLFAETPTSSMMKQKAKILPPPPPYLPFRHIINNNKNTKKRSTTSSIIATSPASSTPPVKVYFNQYIVSFRAHKDRFRYPTEERYTLARSLSQGDFVVVEGASAPEDGDDDDDTGIDIGRVEEKVVIEVTESIENENSVLFHHQKLPSIIDVASAAQIEKLQNEIASGDEEIFAFMAGLPKKQVLEEEQGKNSSSEEIERLYQSYNFLDAEFRFDKKALCVYFENNNTITTDDDDDDDDDAIIVRDLFFVKEDEINFYYHQSFALLMNKLYQKFNCQVWMINCSRDVDQLEVHPFHRSPCHK